MKISVCFSYTSWKFSNTSLLTLPVSFNTALIHHRSHITASSEVYQYVTMDLKTGYKNQYLAADDVLPSFWHSEREFPAISLRIWLQNDPMNPEHQTLNGFCDRTRQTAGMSKSQYFQWSTSNESCPRRSHEKSRNGCATYRKRQLRCMSNFLNCELTFLKIHES